MNTRSASVEDKIANFIDKAGVVLISLFLLFLTGILLMNYLRDPDRLRARRRAVRPIARELSDEIQHDVRFANIRAGVLEIGDKGPLFVAGEVRSEADSAELHHMLDSLHPPPTGVDWNVDVITNENTPPN